MATQSKNASEIKLLRAHHVLNCERRIKFRLLRVYLGRYGFFLTLGSSKVGNVGIRAWSAHSRPPPGARLPVCVLGRVIHNGFNREKSRYYAGVVGDALQGELRRYRHREFDTAHGVGGNHIA